MRTTRAAATRSASGRARGKTAVDDRPAEVAGARGSRAYVTMRDLIVRGRIAPGTRLAEHELGRRLGMSRTPVRAALQRLRHEGFILVDGEGRASRALVAPLTREDARELFDVVAALEGAAARAAAALPVRERRAIVERMRKLNAELRGISRSRAPDADRRFENDVEFHRCYLDAAGRRIRALHDAIQPQVERYVRVYISRLVETSSGEHEAIVEALASGLPERAQRAVEANWRNAAERLARVIDAAGEQGSW